MKKVMILGAGIYQLPLIKKAKEMGLFTIVVSIPGPYPGFRFADRIVSADTKDEKAVLQAALKEKIDGILTTGTDVAVRSIGLVNDTMGLKGISGRAARILTDKAEMKAAFKRAGVSTSAFRLVHDIDEAKAAADELGYPVMMKAVDVSGSRGISKVIRPEDMDEAFALSASSSHTDHYLVERVAGGVEIGLDAFFYRGELVLFQPHEKYVCRAGQVTVPGGHSFPYRADSGLNRRLREELLKIRDAAGLDDCAVNCDIMVDKDEVSVIEAGGRAGATCIPELICLHTGIDYYGEMIRTAMGETPDFSVKTRLPARARLLMSPADGRITAVDRKAIERIKKETGAFISLDYGIGDSVRRMRDGTDRIGQVICMTDSDSVMDELVKDVMNTLAITP
jgi:biotin carboxylase